MPLLSLKPYRFQINLTYQCRVSKTIEKYLLSAAKACLRNIPKATLSKHLKKNTSYGLHITIVSSKAIHKINKRFLNRNRPTNVISFSRGSQHPTPVPDIGDVIICATVARAEAKEWESTFERHIQRLVIHGILHLFGYDHEGSQQKAKIMTALEEKILYEPDEYKVK